MTVYGPLTLRQTIKKELPRSTWDGNFQRWDVVQMPEKPYEFLCQSWFGLEDTDGQHSFNIDAKAIIRYHPDRFHTIEVLSVDTDIAHGDYMEWDEFNDESYDRKESIEENIRQALISGGPYDES
jgi:hypothetical protein